MRSQRTPDFQAATGLANPHLQTIVSRAQRRRAKPQFDRTRIETSDGDFLDLDVWQGLTNPAGTCLLLHGLEGCSRSGYITTTSAALAMWGIQAVALNFRSCSGEPNRTPKSYHSGQTEDIVRSVEWMRERYPSLPIAAAGFSLGGNALINLLGREAQADWVDAAVAISVPYDLAACALWMESGVLGRSYSRHFMKSLRGKAREKAQRFPDLVPARAGLARTIRELDELMTAPLNGFRSAEDYYDRCSAARHIGNVTTPTLLVQAADDPLVPVRVVPLDVIRGRPNLSLRLTTRGGHLGFLDRHLGTGPAGWLEQTIARFVADELTLREPSPPGVRSFIAE